jgi:hypothetical protein
MWKRQADEALAAVAKVEANQQELRIAQVCAM